MKESVHRSCSGRMRLNGGGKRREGDFSWAGGGGGDSVKFSKLLQLHNCDRRFENIPANNTV